MDGEAPGRETAMSRLFINEINAQDPPRGHLGYIGDQSTRSNGPPAPRKGHGERIGGDGSTNSIDGTNEFYRLRWQYYTECDRAPFFRPCAVPPEKSS